MAQAVQVEVMRTVDALALLETVSSQGLAGEVFEEDGRLIVRVSDGRRDAERFRADAAHVLDGWAGEKGLILSPVDEGGFVLRPPGD